jgi:hypothetical protein
MNVNRQSTPQAVLDGPAGVGSLVPRVWCQLYPPLQVQLAHCWAKLVHRMCRPSTTGPGGEHGPVE